MYDALHPSFPHHSILHFHEQPIPDLTQHNYTYSPHPAPCNPSQSTYHKASQHHTLPYPTQRFTKTCRNSPINILLDILDIKHAPTLGRHDDLGHQLRMPDSFPRLHDAHHSRLTLEIAVRRHPLVRLLVFLFRLLQLDLVDLDAVFIVGEAEVHRESVGRGYVAGFGMFGQGPEFGAGQGLEGAVNFCFG